MNHWISMLHRKNSRHPDKTDNCPLLSPLMCFVMPGSSALWLGVWSKTMFRWVVTPSEFLSTGRKSVLPASPITSFNKPVCAERNTGKLKTHRALPVCVDSTVWTFEITKITHNFSLNLNKSSKWNETNSKLKQPVTRCWACSEDAADKIRNHQSANYRRKWWPSFIV